MTLTRSDFLGTLRAGAVLPSAETPPAADTAEQPEDRAEADPSAEEAPAVPTQVEDPKTAQLIATLNKRVEDSQVFIKQLLAERAAERKSAEPAAPSAVERLTELGIPADTIRDLVREVAAEVVESRVAPGEKNAAANAYMASQHPEYVKALPQVLSFLEQNPRANEDVMELVAAGKPKAAHLLAWASYLEAQGPASKEAATAEAAAAQAARNAAKANAAMVPAGQHGARPTGDKSSKGLSQAERIARAQEIAARTGDKRALTIERTRANWGQIVADIAARPR